MTSETGRGAPLDENRENVQGVVFHDDYELSILLEADGRLRAVLHAVGVDGVESFKPGAATVVSTARHGEGGEQRADDWSVRLLQLQTTMKPVNYRTTPPGAAPGQPATVECVATPIPAADGTLDSILLQAYDRTSTDRVQQQLRESEARFRFLAEALPQMVWVTDETGDVSYFSPQWSAFTGRSEEALLGKGFLDLVHPDDIGLIHANRGASDEFQVLVFRLRRHDGEYRWVEADYRTLYDAAGTPIRWVGATSDVTDRLDDEAASRETQEQLAIALSVTRMGRYTRYFGDDRLICDGRFCEIVGHGVDTLVGSGVVRRLFAMIHVDDVDHVRRAAEVAVSGGPEWDVEYRIWRPVGDGSGATELRWIGVRGRVEFDDAGAPFRILGVVEDITERRAEEEARLRWQKREAIGSLAGGVAHDFNNVVSAILSNASLAETELRIGVSPETSIAEISRGAERASEIVRRLLAFSREEDVGADAVAAPFDVGEVVKEACGLVAPTLPSGATLHQDIAPSLPPVTGSAADLHRVVVNLLANAGYAIAGTPGTVRVIVDAVEASRGDGTASALTVRIRVEDTGVGITQAVLARIFDPFFTTKPAGKGTGLGLAAAQTIVRDHGGTLEAENVEDGGARFTVLLPATSAEPTPGGAAPLAAEGDARAPAVFTPVVTDQAVVMFVDDEVPLVRLAERALPGFGFAVRVHTDPQEALAAFRERPDEADALVTDLSMPGLTGLELIQEVRRVRPDLPVVLSSGFLTSANRQAAERLGVDEILPKPCSIDALARALAGLLNDR